MGFRLENNDIQKKYVIPGDRRWAMYYRLQELGVACSCSAGHPLTVEVETAAAAIQVWSVGQTHLRELAILRRWLEQCWIQE
jgi:hypothetical protein